MINSLFNNVHTFEKTTTAKNGTIWGLTSTTKINPKCSQKRTPNNSRKNTKNSKQENNTPGRQAQQTETRKKRKT